MKILPTQQKFFLTLLAPLFFFLTLSLLIVPSASAEVRQITDNAVFDGGADFDNNRVVWRGIVPGSPTDIFMYNVITQQTTQITNTPTGEGNPQIDGGKVMWVNNFQIFVYDIATATTTPLNGFTNSSADLNDGNIVWAEGSQLVLYDVTTGTQTQLANASGLREPKTNNGLITWIQGGDNNAEVYVYNIATDVTTQIPYNGAASSLQINNGKVVWSNGGDIFYYDVSSQALTQITDNTYIDVTPQVNNGKIVWRGGPTSDESEIYLYDTTSGITTQLTDDLVLDTAPQIDGNKVAWYHVDTSTDIKLYLYDLVTATTTEIASNVNLLRETIRISNGKVVWSGFDMTMPQGQRDFELFIWGEVFDSFNTPPGTNVDYSQNGVTLTFSNVTAGGDTSITSSNQGTQPPAGFKIGNPPTYFSISTTATFTGTVEVCIDTSTINTNGNGPLRIMHFESGTGWVILTTTSINGSIICANTTSFSDFAVMRLPTISELITTVQSMNLNQGIENSLDAKLTAAQEALSASNNGQSSTAINKLNSFINEVEAQRGNKITNAQADELHAFAENLIKLLQGETTF